MKKLYSISLLLFAILPFWLNAQVWESYNPGFPDTVGVASVDVVDDNVVWAIGIRYGIDECLYSFFQTDKSYYARTDDGGATWHTGELPLGTLPFLANISALNANTAWVAGLDANGGGSKILKTTDGGATWTQQTTAAFDPAASWVDFVHFRSPAAGVAMGDPRDGYFEIYTTGNGGDFWFRVPAANIDPPLADEFGYNGAFDAVGNNYWFATNRGRVYRSTNAGNSWTAHQTTLSDSYFLSFPDANNGLVAQVFFDDCSTFPPNFHFELSRTTDGGATWTNATPANNNYAVSGLRFIKGTSAALMTLRESNLSGGYYTWLTQDYGESWMEIDSSENIGWMDFINGETGWGGEPQMLNNETNMLKYTGNPLSGLFNSKELEVQTSLFPNPTSGIFQITITTPLVDDYLLLINDPQGRLVKKEIIENEATFQRQVNLAGLAAGVYSVTVSSKEGSFSTKILKQ